MANKAWFKHLHFLDFPEEGDSPERYRLLRRRIIVLMIVVTVAPLAMMALVNYHQYQNSIREEIVNPLVVLVDKTKHSVELFLAERLSTVSFIASAYTFEQLADEDTLNRVFRVMKQEFGGFVDLGLIDGNGVQVSYAGPYNLKGLDYTEQPWLHEVQIRGTYISDVFMGFRRFPHIVMAVQRREDKGRTWILRATIDTEKFNELIGAMRPDVKSDAFLINRSGVLQTASKGFGGVLEKLPIPLPPYTSEANVMMDKDPQGREVMIAYSYFLHSPYALILVKPQAEVMQSWYTLKTELVYYFLIGVALIFMAVFKLTDVLVTRMRESDEKREAAFRQIEHSHKLSSVGRLAAGVAHEINNPMAIINEKAGLMKDLIERLADFPEKQKLDALSGAIISSVERCRSVTHRLLGFARRMDVQVEVLDINEILKETWSFLEKEALYRNVEVKFQLDANLPRIPSDRGQLQQVFLNLFSNSIAAVESGGVITITSCDRDVDTVGVSIQDDGCGMSEETLSHIFEPFFTTKKKGHGTGLGLSITYGIVRKLGGQVEARSKQGQGTTMTVFLPKRHPEGAGE